MLKVWDKYSAEWGESTGFASRRELELQIATGKYSERDAGAGKPCSIALTIRCGRFAS